MFDKDLRFKKHFDGFLNKLKAYSDIEYLGEVIEHSWGQRVIRFYDLDEHLIEVGEDMQMVVKRFLASGMTMEELSYLTLGMEKRHLVYQMEES